MVVYFTDETMRKSMEDQLRESEENFRSLIHNLNLGVIVQNEKSEILISNKAALDMLGLTEEQLLGTTSFDQRWNVIHEDGADFPGNTHPGPIAIQTRQPVRDVVMGVYRPATNDRVWLFVNAEPIIDAGNNIISVICSFADITEQKRLSQELMEQEIQKQKLLTQATIDGQEKERLEIGKELHDNISQHLTTTRLYLEVAKEKASGEMMEMISYAHKNVSDIINELRHLSQSLVPPSLGDLGLIESVQDLCAAIGRTHTFELEFHHRHFSEEDLPENMKLMFFRIIQEQINNIVRHAYANLVLIRLQADAEQIILTISDNGKGFDPAQHKKGLGFTSIANRASLFGGKMHIETAPGKGSTVTIAVPFTKELS
jgi:PAS domain S-box-containing protein